MFEKLIFGNQFSVFNHATIARRGAVTNVFIKTRRLKILRCNTRELDDEEIELA